MTLWRARKVLSPAVAIIFCVCMYAVLWKHLLPSKIRMRFYHGESELDIKSSAVRTKEASSTQHIQQSLTNITLEPQEVLPNTVKLTRLPTTATVTKKKSQIKTSIVSKETPHKIGVPKPVTPKIGLDDVNLIPILYKKNFTKMPQWDFEDEYLRDAHPQQTTCQKYVRNTNDVDFRKAFIPDIQLFMHHEHLNKSEWNRMSHFNNPFGFMDYNYTDVKRAVDLIPKLKSYELLPVPQSGCIRCAVVGTSGILSGSRMGQEIDSHDYVFRMNGAVIKGYEEDVGNKTSVYVHTAFSVRASLIILQRHGFKSIPQDKNIKYVMIPEGERDYEWIYGLMLKKAVTSVFPNTKPWEYYPEPLDMNSFFVLHPDFLRYVKNRFLKSKTLDTEYWALHRPTNGAYALFLALHTCDVVDAYGFITDDHGKYNNYYFEKGNRTSVIFYINHDYNMEAKLWKKFHDAKIITLYQRGEDKSKV